MIVYAFQQCRGGAFLCRNTNKGFYWSKTDEDQIVTYRNEFNAQQMYNDGDYFHYRGVTLSGAEIVKLRIMVKVVK